MEGLHIITLDDCDYEYLKRILETRIHEEFRMMAKMEAMVSKPEFYHISDESVGTLKKTASSFGMDYMLTNMLYNRITEMGENDD